MAFRVMRYSKLKQISQIIRNNIVRCMSSQSDSNKNIGFIGLGNMGKNMSSNLMKRGHKLHVYDISQTAVEAIESKGATAYNNVQDLAQESDFVITMLPNNDIVYNTYKTMVEDCAPSNTLFIDSSTIDPKVVRAVQKLVESKGGHFIDAPVSGGVPGAEKATLTFMVGGTADEFESAKPILKCMGKRITHCGDYGMGQAAKLCNNMMLAISMIGISETMNLAIRLGLDPKLFTEIINSSTGRCWSSESYNPVPGIVATAPASNKYKNGFSTDLMTKDLGLITTVATRSNTPIPMGGLAHELYRTLKAKGLGKKDFSVAYDFLKNEENN